ncbi:SMP-30/gluconolactonase/LRE family protein [Planosporangium thailandense]|uniref:SMP-30/gluconolactonase/LRE family protein n=1 Tax=Planosporangium thailandense TaxID=765197 RepID=A0ABX0Y2E1_9ACTN|nr:SMP-30/gluconolactonase/LRE family protein [Planosporangium thailandense]NJC71740.1 SMP-30/gluconolactonase/LRE family protein [Planosporangium thailandense]
MATPTAPRWIDAAKAPASTPPPLEGEWAPADTRLDDLQRYPLPSGHGPEDVVVDAEGRLVTGTDDGRLWRWPVHDGQRPVPAPELVADTGGRPLGIEVDPRDGSLVVCDAERGLLRVTGDGAVTPLADRAAGKPIRLCDNAAVARDGTVYFSDSSDRYGFADWRLDLLEHRPNGRLLRYDPASGDTDVVAGGLYFPNGVALTPDESALLFVETSMHRLMRLPLDGGSPTRLADLPAYPDNMAPVGDGTYWIALPSPRVAALERLLPYPRVRQLVAKVPERLQPQPKRYGLAALVDGAGRVLRTLHGPAGRYLMITGVRQHGSTLWLGSLTENAVARVSLDAGPG